MAMISPSQHSSNWRERSNDLKPSITPHQHRPATQYPSRQRTIISSRTPKGEDDPLTLQAIEEGRRLYVGNMPYKAKEADVLEFFLARSYPVVYVSISIDPFTGRSPGYCFIELASKEDADSAISELQGQELLDRPVKLGPCSPRAKKEKAAYERWSRNDAEDYWYSCGSKGRQLRVDGLPRMGSHYEVDHDVRNLFQEFRVEAVSKVVIHQPESCPYHKTHRFLFVNFATAQEAEAAMKAKDGKWAWGVRISVKRAEGHSRKVDERQKLG